MSLQYVGSIAIAEEKGVDHMAGKKRRPSKSNRLGMFVIAAIVAVLLIGLLVQSQHLADSNAKKEVRKEELQQEIKDEEIRAEEIERLKEDINSPEYIEKIAREKLGLVYDDEIIFKSEE